MTRRREVGLSRERHESDLKEKTRMFSESFVENMELFQNRVIRLREAEFERQKREKEEHVQVRKQERDVKKKQIYYLKCEERIRKRKKLASREWETIPYAAGVIVPLALTLLVRNAKKDKKRGVIVDVVGGDPCHTVRNHQFRDPVSSHWEDISTLPDLSSRSRARTTATGFCGYERRVVHCVTGLIQVQRHCGYYLFIFGRGSSLSVTTSLWSLAQ
ncbi:hypothetical protein Rs2_28177 [Raphanus sativus]|nr:hypothetical protein Rs2_28177 [Raphanus sativus]